MHRSPFRRVVTPWSVWIALLAVVLQSLMPMVAHARAHVDAGHAAAQGVALHDHHGEATPCATLPPPSDDASGHAPASDISHGGGHCPYCRVHVDGLILPGAAQRHWVVLVALHAVPVVDAPVPRPHADWAPAHPRGPPAFA